MDMISRFVSWVLFLPFFLVAFPAVSEPLPLIIGLDADLSSGSARSGIAIQRGAELAVDEINAKGGVLGRPLKLVLKDHRGIPARGIDNIEELSSMEGVVAVLGGLHTPVALSELKIIHEKQMIYLGPWAAGTPIVKNNFDPNYVFRISVRDQYAGGFLISEALKRGHKKIALVLENTGWGRSNERAMKAALNQRGLKPAIVSWFHWGTADFEAVFKDLKRSKPDVILLVANAPEGLKIVQHMAQTPQEDRLPIISHWGITGGDFFAQAKDLLGKVDLSFLQTFSFLKPTFPSRADKVIKAYIRRFENANSVEDIFAPVGTAHAYDLVHILAQAVQRAGSVDRVVIRKALEKIDFHGGLVRDYSPPFSASKHDALDVGDFKLARFDAKGVITPLD